MSTASFPENSGYRSIVQWLNLYCLYKIVFFAWKVWPILQRIPEDSLYYAFFLAGYYRLFITPVMIVALIIISGSRFTASHILRLGILSFCFAYRLYYFPNILQQGGIANIAPALFDFICLPLFFFLLIQRRRSSGQQKI